MELGYYSDEKNVIKFAAESYVGVGGNPVVLFVESAEWLYNCYKNTGDKVCLKAAGQIIRVYMEMGLLYETAREIFDKILEEEGRKAEEDFPKRLYSQNVLKRNATHIREVLGYWPKTHNKKHNPDWITKEILNKVEDKHLGCYYYGKTEHKVSVQLVVLKKAAYLIDLEKSKIYVFEQFDKNEGQ